MASSMRGDTGALTRQSPHQKGDISPNTHIKVCVPSFLAIETCAASCILNYQPIEARWVKQQWRAEGMGGEEGGPGIHRVSILR